MIECYECKKCNRKGKPSVMRGSLFCDNNIINKQIIRFNFIERIRKFTEERFIDKKTGKIKLRGGFRW